MATITDIPPEIITQVLRYKWKGRSSDLYHAALVCHHWSTIALAELYRELCLSGAVLERFCEAPAACRFATKRLAVSCYSHASLEVLFQRCRGVEELELILDLVFEHDVNWGVLAAPSLSGLKVLSMLNPDSFHEPKPLIDFPFRLSTLILNPKHVWTSPHLTDACFRALSSTSTTLDISCDWRPDYEHILPQLELVSSSLSTLSLGLSYVSSRQDYDQLISPFFAILPTFVKLETIQLDMQNQAFLDSTEMTPADERMGDALVRLAKHLPKQLRVVKLASVVLGQFSYIKTIIKELRRSGSAVEEFVCSLDIERAWDGSEEEEQNARAKFEELGVRIVKQL